ncbi:MAG: hypothetical protein LBE07_04560, partial [Gordonia sp. (in: high G+C Gram-positive bacteria)]|nr:hypothetical protein [Gordonia sp. (in: high G+C Gram-positive bacteria)]
DNAAQLAERLRATRDEAAKNSIIDDGYLGVRLGTSLADIRAKHPDFPESGRTQGSRTVYDWRDCDWTTNSEGDLVEIAPRGRTARTVDGIGSGSTVGEARVYYGAPTSDTKNPDGSRTVVFAESGAGEAGYRMIVDGDGDDGVIRTIVICHCVVRTLDPCSGASGTCRHVADADVDGDGTADPIGVSIETTEETGRADTTVIGQAPVEARVAIRGKVHAVEYEVDGVFWKDPKDTYRGAYGISHATGADVVLYLAVSQGAPDVFGVARWNGSTLAALKPPTPSVRPQSSHPEQWWMGNVEQGRIVVNCRAPGTIAVDVSRRAPGADNSTDRTTTAYRFFGKGWVAGAIQTGPGPVLDYRPDGWKPETGAFACRDLGRRR